MKPAEKASLQRLQQRMDRIPKAVRRAVRPAIEASAQELVARQKALVPVDTGALRASIGYVFGEAPKTRATGAFRPSGGPTLDADLKASVFAGNDGAYYARWVEFGTQPHDGHPGASPRPFFYPAFRLTRKRATARIQRAVSKAVREGWK